MKKLSSYFVLGCTLLFATNAVAITTQNDPNLGPTQVPEPSMLPLFLVAGVIALLVKKRNK